MLQTYAPRTTLIDTLVPRTGLLRDVLLVLSFSALVALSAQVTIRLLPVPITGQTFAVLLAGAALGRVRGTLAMVAYLAEGLAGLPVFAGGNSAWTPSASGLPYIVGPTAGYLAGFMPAAFATGWLAEMGWDRSVFRWLGAMVAGNLVIYAFGLSVLSFYLGLPAAIERGVMPFIPGDIIKIVVAALALPGAWRLVGDRPNGQTPPTP
jgi:biotin transport system substrate-specific component